MILPVICCYFYPPSPFTVIERESCCSFYCPRECRTVENRVDVGTAVRMHSTCPELQITVDFVTDTNCSWF